MNRRSLFAPKVILAILIPIMAFLTLASWSLSSSVGASPDDDFHLASIWCGLGDRPGLCENLDNDPVHRYIPAPAANTKCFAFNPAVGGACWNSEAPGLTEVDRANVDHLYPPVFYGTMSIFASDNVAASVIVMRLFNSAFAVGLLTGVFFALPRRLRTPLIASVAATSIPLGVFVYSSTNPSSWALLSAAIVWITLVGSMQTTGRRRIVLAALAVFGAVIGGGARADSAVYAIFAVVLALVLALRRPRQQLIPLGAAVAVVAISVAFYLSAWQGASIVGGIGGDRPPLTAGQHLSNLLNVPSLWTGALGGWALGWLDTSMPAVVSVLGAAVFWGAIFIGVGRANVRRTVALVMCVAAMWLIPFLLLAQSKMVVGEVIQPRYLLPLMIIAVGVASARADAERSWRGARFLLAASALILINTIALHINIQRYTTGLTQVSLDPGSHATWWWAHAPSPAVVWVGGSLVFALFFGGLWWVMRGRSVNSTVIDDGEPSAGTPAPLPDERDASASRPTVAPTSAEPAGT